MWRRLPCLMANIDWYTHNVLTSQISKTLESDFYIKVQNQAIHNFNLLKVVNTEYGSKFRSFDWTQRLHRSSIQISMDGRGRLKPLAQANCANK